MMTFKEALELTPLQMDSARDNKRQVLVHMKPEHFLHLTTSDDDQVSRIKAAAHALSDYNQWGREGETINSPFISIDREGNVLNHEGRHRAAAVMSAGHRTMPVHIKIRDRSSDERKLGWEHVPDTLRGQFGRGEVKKSELVRDER